MGKKPVEDLPRGKPNEILRLISEYVGQGFKIQAILIDSKIAPKKVTFVFATRRPRTRKVAIGDRQEFVTWWKQATSYLRASLTKEIRRRSPTA